MKAKNLFQIIILAVLISAQLLTTFPALAKPETAPVLATQTVVNYQAPCKSGLRAGVTTWHDNGSLARYAYDWICEGSNEVYAPHSGVVKYTHYYASPDITHGMVMIYDPENNVCITMAHLNSSFAVSVGNQVTTDTKIGTYTDSEGHTHMAVNPGPCGSYNHANEQPIIFSEIGKVLPQKITINGTMAGSDGARVWVTDGAGATVEQAFANGVSTPTIDADTVNLKVCGDNVNGKVVYWQMWRNAVDNAAERVWDGQGTASGNCITFSDMDGGGPVFSGVSYYTVASLNPIGADQAKLLRTSCYSATGGKQLCDTIVYAGATVTCTAGKNVDAAFLTDTINNLNTQTEHAISNNDFAVKALQIWQRYEGTNACWNPLATTWGRPNATNFNSVGVKNYATRADGIAATANTIGTKNSGNYQAIRQMLGLNGFDEGGLAANLKTYSGGGGYVTNLMNEWRTLYNQYAGIQPPIPTINTRQQMFWDQVYNSSVDAMNYDKWPFLFTDTREFTLTLNRASGDLKALIILFSSSGQELARAEGADKVVLSGTQPKGDYYVIIQPTGGSGSYSIGLVKGLSVPPTLASAFARFDPAVIEIGKTVTTSFSYDPQGQPVKGLEFVCTYDQAALKYIKAAEAGAFGSDPVFAPVAGENGKRTWSIAGSNEQMMSSSGLVFSATFETLSAADVSLNCSVRRMTQSDEMQDVPFTPAALKINGVEPPIETNFNVTGQVSLNNKAYSTATLHILDASGKEIASLQPDADGKFSVKLPAGQYTFTLSAPGCLSATRTDTISANTNFPTVTLLAGDIDQNGVIDPLDVVTLGNQYGKSPLTLAAADLTGDQQVGLQDLVLLAANYRKSGPTAWK